MQKVDNEILYSASDIVNFLECEHLTTLDIINLSTPLPKTVDDEQSKLIKEKGYEHEEKFEKILSKQYSSFVNIASESEKKDIDSMVITTTQAMQAGVEVICQATFRNNNFLGHADFLRRISKPSSLGDFSYEVLDTKLAKKTKAKFLIQLSFYSVLLAKIQGVSPRKMYIVFGDMSEKGFLFNDYHRYFDALLQRFITQVNTPDTNTKTYPDPCKSCHICKWKEICEDVRIKDDHLCQVANITKIQTNKLQKAGVNTLERLGSLPIDASILKIAPATMEKLISQASLQLAERNTGTKQIELLSYNNQKSGFARIPCPATGDLFFDMEGDPLEDGGLEYLFGLYFFKDEKPIFKAFWAHSRSEEKTAFEQFMDFVTNHLARHPEAHIYHYAHYEETALKKLMCLHGTREAEVDNLLRDGKLIDLYKVVRESIRVSEPRYSIKNLEHFYLEQRSTEVTDAGASIVYYERWKESGDEQFLKDIELYNFDDVRSTYQLREWLLTLKPDDIPWANGFENTAAPAPAPLTPADLRLIPYREQLIETAPINRDLWEPEHYQRELTYQLLDFNRRAAKPHWWAMFSRQGMMEDELIDDIECLAGLKIDNNNPPRKEKRSWLYTCTYPEQETKLKSDDGAICISSLKPISSLCIKEEKRIVTFKYAAANEPLGDEIHIGPGGPIQTQKLTDALFRFADSIVADNQRYPAIQNLLSQKEPIIRGHKIGDAIIKEDQDHLQQSIDAISNLETSVMFIQGPPGSGKTYTGSHVIVALLQKGFKVGVSSNSHKAINNLLAGVEQVALESDFHFRGAKKSNAGKEDSHIGGKLIEDVFSNEDIICGDYQLIAGTAWLFSDDRIDQTLDYIFIDEAGQVALAYLVAMATCSKNIVLLGDQMQLGQPIQGVHPGRSGESSLEYLLDDYSTIPPERGIFLANTWRMHPDVCRFISDAVYDGRLKAETQNKNQQLILNAQTHPALLPTGIRYIPVAHDACSQSSADEAEVVKELVQSLLGQHYSDRTGAEHPITLDDVLVVAPYNLQVNLLKKLLPQGCRVGTVDKFQGQEAEVVIISMATSNGDYLPRFINFLYSKNRLNVAISRARCLAVLVANPDLMSIKCSKAEDMALVNTLCWVRDYSMKLDSNRRKTWDVNLS